MKCSHIIVTKSAEDLWEARVYRIVNESSTRKRYEVVGRAEASNPHSAIDDALLEIVEPVQFQEGALV